MEFYKHDILLFFVVMLLLGCDPRDWIALAEDWVQWRAYVRAAMNLRVP